MTNTQNYTPEMIHELLSVNQVNDSEMDYLKAIIATNPQYSYQCAEYAAKHLSN